MRWSSKLVPSRIKKLLAAITVAGAGLFTNSPTLPAQDVLPPSVLECENCFDGGLGGWNLYWHDPGECNSSCHCLMGDWTCPTAAAPWIFASVDFMPLIRDQMSPVIFAARAVPTSTLASTTIPGNAGPPATPSQTTTTKTTTVSRFADLTEDDFSNEFDPGMKISLGIALNDQLRLEGSYIGNYQWNGTVDTRLADPSLGDATNESGNLLSPFSHFGDKYGRSGLPTLTNTEITTTVNSAPPVSTTDATGVTFDPVRGIDFNSFVQVAYSSQISMGEVNLRRRLSNISTPRVAAEASVLIGFREVTLAETLGYQADAVLVGGSVVHNVANVAVNNRLWGMQIGGQTQFLVSQRTWIDFEAKGAILFGTANSSVSASFPYLTSTVGEYSASENSTAFLGELSAHYNYQFTQSLTLSAGYNAFFLGGVALASKNLDHDVGTLLTGAPQPDHTGRVAYHGPSLGLVFAR